MEQEENIKTKPSMLSKFNLFLVIALGITCGIAGNWGYKYSQSAELSRYLAEEKIKSLETSLEETEEQLSKLQESIKEIQLEYFLEKLSGVIDFTVPSIQTIGDGFMLSKAEQQEHLTGIKFKGRILNTQSVRHKNITFKLTVNKISKNFTINQVSAGNSTSFTVYIPDIKAEDARYGKIEYQESTVEYYTK